MGHVEQHLLGTRHLSVTCDLGQSYTTPPCWTYSANTTCCLIYLLLSAVVCDIILENEQAEVTREEGWT